MRLIILLSLAVNGFSICRAVAAEAPQPQAFETHDGYFVSNKFEPDIPTSFVVLTDQESFDKVFGAAVVMRDKARRLPPAAFAEKFVVAAIHRGKAMVTYQVDSVGMEAGSLLVRYTTKSTPDDNAEFACPLILSLRKVDLKNVRFVENGKEIKVIPFHAQQEAEPGGRKPAELTEENAAGKTVFSIRGPGIGRETARCKAEQWPKEVVLRAYLRGLESLVIVSGTLKMTISVLSHSGHPTLLTLWQDGKEGPQLTKASPYWCEVRRLGPDGKEVAGLPPEGGWFELRIPPAMLKKSRELKVEWIDFYR